MWGAVMLAVAMEVPVLWEPAETMPPTLRDLVSRLPEDCPAWEPCPITWGHEASHFLATGRRPGWHGIYMLRGEREYIPVPPLLTAQVFAQIPEDRRGTIYRIYLIQAGDSYWQANSLMILDEWVAYLRGCQIRKELGLERRQETVRYCALMAGYAVVLYRMSQSCDGYDHEALRDFCREILAQCRETIPEWDEISDARF